LGFDRPAQVRSIAEKSKKRIFKRNYHMSKDELKLEINKVLDLLPDKVLEDILAVIKNLGDKSVGESLLDSAALQRILTEDKALLQKLAQ
jgi:hypothetical protein